MNKYFIRKPRTQDSSPVQDSSPMQDSSSSSKRICVDFNLENLPSDLGLRQKTSSYHPNNHDEIRRYYLTKGHCQPVVHDYPISYFSRKLRRFRFEWYVNRRWLEYSIDKDAAFCFYCLLRNTLTKFPRVTTVCDLMLGTYVNLKLANPLTKCTLLVIW